MRGCWEYSGNKAGGNFQEGALGSQRNNLINKQTLRLFLTHQHGFLCREQPTGVVFSSRSTHWRTPSSRVKRRAESTPPHRARANFHNLRSAAGQRHTVQQIQSWKSFWNTEQQYQCSERVRFSTTESAMATVSLRSDRFQHLNSTKGAF